jgi:hypothetical protein
VGGDRADALRERCGPGDRVDVFAAAGRCWWLRALKLQRDLQRDRATLKSRWRS